MVLKTYKFRIYPTKDQESTLTQMFGCSRFVWNYFLNNSKAHYTNTKEHLSYFDNCRLLTLLKQKEETSFLKNTNSQVLQASIKNLDKAFQAFFKKQRGFPKFKNKNRKQSIHIPQNLSVESNQLFIPKLKSGIEIVLHRNFNGKIKTSTISKTKTNKYFVSICVEESIKELPKTDKSIGIDLGIKTFAVLSNGEEIQKQKISTKLEKKLKICQRHLSRKQKGSGKKEKQRVKLARLHEKILNKKQDFMHKASTKLINENQVICLEDLNVKGMLKNRKLAKSIQDCSWSSFVSMLEYKAKWYGRTIIFVDRFYPSSKLCNKCGWKNEGLRLEDREWFCNQCGTNHKRDLNASKNILKQGLKIASSAGTADYERGENIKLKLSQEGNVVLGEAFKVQESNCFFEAHQLKLVSSSRF
jgi:putative transposase